MDFNQWWGKSGREPTYGMSEVAQYRFKMCAKAAWSASEKRVKVWQWVCLIIVWAMVAFEIFQFVALVDYKNQTGVWGPPEKAHPNIAIDTTVPRTPHVFTKHKYGMKNRTMGVYLP